MEPPPGCGTATLANGRVSAGFRPDGPGGGGRRRVRDSAKRFLAGPIPIPIYPADAGLFPSVRTENPDRAWISARLTAYPPRKCTTPKGMDDRGASRRRPDDPSAAK